MNVLKSLLAVVGLIFVCLFTLTHCSEPSNGHYDGDAGDVDSSDEYDPGEEQASVDGDHGQEPDQEEFNDGFDGVNESEDGDASWQDEGESSEGDGDGSHVTCQELKDEFTATYEAGSECIYDSDCSANFHQFQGISWGLNCVYCCFLPLSYDADVDLLRSLALEWMNLSCQDFGCCDGLPTTITCQNGRCVFDESC